MHAELNAQLAFHLTGARSAAALEPIDTGTLRPALFGAYRDLTALRYDFPLVFTQKSIVPLSHLVDEALKQVTDERVRVRALRREREIRARLAGGLGGRLRALWAPGRTQDRGRRTKDPGHGCPVTRAAHVY